MLATSTSYASGDLSGYGINNQVKISVTNDQTGETTLLNPIETKDLIEVNSIKSDKESIEVGYDVFIPLEKLYSSDIIPFIDAGGSKNQGGVTARLNANYDVRGNDIRVNRVWGSWSPNSSIYYLSNRNVYAHAGSFMGNNLSRSPDSNTFSYITGWDWNPRLSGDGAARAWSDAKVHVSGMEGSTYTIEVDFSFE